MLKIWAMSAEGSGSQSDEIRRAADRAQADYFRDELQREFQALAVQADKLQVQLADHVRHQRSLEAFRLEEALRSVAVARRTVSDMLSALAGRFPSR
ncbi:hypothetical protein B1R94_19925 [Mycolicibacterium litorale]|nr:hypothetical protein B1R94_19925 [Mycolicibacterium litorale]